jgi:aspartyl protease family protein
MRSCLVAALLIAACGLAAAQTVSLSGKLGDKALLVIDGAPRTVATGATVAGVKLLSIGDDSAQVEVGGKRVSLPMGGAQVDLGVKRVEGTGTRIVLTAGSGGHFMAGGSINGRAVNFMVDTGATTVALSRSEAERLGIDVRNAEPGLTNTANGQVQTLRVKLSSVRVGDITVYDVDGTLLPTPMPFVLLGNSFLTRFQMKRENDQMTLERRY